MITFVWIFGGIILVLGLLGVLYMGTRHSKGDETGRRSETATGPAKPARTEGRET